MKQVTFAKYGAPLIVIPLNLPETLKPKSILLKVNSVSLNPIDFKRRDGMTRMFIKDEFPAGICFDVSGVVEKVGAEVSSKFVPGQRVAARSLVSGVLADYCIVDESVTCPIPENVSFTDAAALPLAGMTALQSLRMGGLKKGGSVFISGGAGGVGSYAVQLAKHVFEASRVVVTCSSSKSEFCKSLGADECIDYKKNNPYDAKIGSFDVCFDTVGEARHMGALIKPDCTVVSVASMPTPNSFSRTGHPEGWFLKSLLYVISIRERLGTRPGKYEYLLLNPNAKDLSELLGYLSEGKLKSPIDSVFKGIEKSPEAFARIETNRAQGKVIVQVQTT